MPASSPKQQRFMGADLARAKAGKKTKTGMGIPQLEDFARNPVKKPLKKKPLPPIKGRRLGYDDFNTGNYGV